MGPLRPGSKTPQGLNVPQIRQSGPYSGLDFKVKVVVGGVPLEQKMLKGHLHRVIYHQVY